MSQLQLSLLGTPVVKHGERTLTFSTRKAQALLVYLAVEGGTHPRKTLSESFWPELDAGHGRAALRATLLELRKLLERSHGPGEPAHLLGREDRVDLGQFAKCSQLVIGDVVAVFFREQIFVDPMPAAFGQDEFPSVFHRGWLKRCRWQRA